MTPICRQPIDDASAWTVQTIGGKQNLTIRLRGGQLDAIDDLLERTRHLAPQQVTRSDFDHPVVNKLLWALREEIMDGRGIVVVSGITPQRYNEEEFQRIYWGFGTHLGVGAVQSAAGDRLGYVQNREDDPVKRGYRSLRELHMHTDSYELVGLMRVRKAKSDAKQSMRADVASILGILVLISPEMKYFARSGSSSCFNDCCFFDISSRISNAGMKPLSQ